MDHQFTAQMVISVLIVWAIQKAKKSPLVPWLSVETKSLNRTIAVAASLLNAIGIRFSFSWHDGTLLITGLTLAGVGHFFWSWLVSFVSQQYIFQTSTKQSLSPELQKLLEGVARALSQPMPASRTDFHPTVSGAENA